MDCCGPNGFTTTVMLHSMFHSISQLKVWARFVRAG
jgi:hypothetical protein